MKKGNAWQLEAVLRDSTEGGGAYKGTHSWAVVMKRMLFEKVGSLFTG
jgi:hypothetical protein